MTDLLRHLLSASYLYAQNTYPPRTVPPAFLAWAFLLTLGAVAAWRWKRKLKMADCSCLGAKVALWSCVAGLFLVVLRFQVTGALSARVWSLSATALALGAPLAHGLGHLLKRSAPARRLVRALACGLSPRDEPLPGAWRLASAVVHLFGLYSLARYGGVGWWPAALVVTCLLAAAWGQGRLTGRRDLRLVRLELLTPLLLPYGTCLLRWLLGDLLRVDLLPYQAFPYPDPWSPWFSLRATLAAGTAWVLLTIVAFLRRCRFRRLSVALAGYAILALVLSWYAAFVFMQRSHGASGSDPYCYLQMGVDLAERGTPLHSFPLASLARDAQLPVWPTVHLGYHPPTIGTLASTVWPIGWPLLLVPFYWLGGEGALLWAAPALTALGACLVFTAARDLWPERANRIGWISAAVAALLVTTSQESMLRSLVPMADAAAQTFSILTLLCLLRARRGDSLRWGALGGASFAMAYFVRHPQLPLGLAALCPCSCQELGRGNAGYTIS